MAGLLAGTTALFGRGLPAAIVLAGLLWLWIAEGAVYWPYVVGALTGIGCAGLGYYACWATKLRPARQQAAERAGLASTNYQRLEPVCSQERERRRAVEAELDSQRAEADPLRQLVAQARRADAKAKGAPHTGTGQIGTGLATTGKVRSGNAGTGRDLSGLVGRQAGSELEPESDELVVVRLHCFTVADEESSSRKGLPSLAVERTVVAASRDRFAEFTGRTKKAGQDHDEGFCDRLVDAVAAYCAETAGDPIFKAATEWWEIRASYPEVAAADAFSAINDRLLELVQSPLDELARESPIPVPVGSPAAGVAARVILGPVAETLTKATELCAVAGLLAGAAFGQPHLVMASVKILAKEGFNQSLAEGVKGAFREASVGLKSDIAHESGVARGTAEPHIDKPHFGRTDEAGVRGRKPGPTPVKPAPRIRLVPRPPPPAEIKPPDEINRGIGGFGIGR